MWTGVYDNQGTVSKDEESVNLLIDNSNENTQVEVSIEGILILPSSDPEEDTNTQPNLPIIQGVPEFTENSSNDDMLTKIIVDSESLSSIQKDTMHRKSIQLEAIRKIDIKSTLKSTFSEIDEVSESDEFKPLEKEGSFMSRTSETKTLEKEKSFKSLQKQSSFSFATSKTKANNKKQTQKVLNPNTGIPKPKDHKKGKEAILKCLVKMENNLHFDYYRAYAWDKRVVVHGDHTESVINIFNDAENENENDSSPENKMNKNVDPEKSKIKKEIYNIYSVKIKNQFTSDCLIEKDVSSERILFDYNLKGKDSF
jgi:hypothetical protein